MAKKQNTWILFLKQYRAKNSGNFAKDKAGMFTNSS
jgi:hypothetical protein